MRCLLPSGVYGVLHSKNGPTHTADEILLVRLCHGGDVECHKLWKRENSSTAETSRERCISVEERVKFNGNLLIVHIELEKTNASVMAAEAELEAIKSMFAKEATEEAIFTDSVYVYVKTVESCWMLLRATKLALRLVQLKFVWSMVCVRQ